MDRKYASAFGRLLLVGAFVLLAPPRTLAQIAGQVRSRRDSDATGAVYPGANVTATNVATA
jgi:hypothetical protein